MVNVALIRAGRRLFSLARAPPSCVPILARAVGADEMGMRVGGRGNRPGFAKHFRSALRKIVADLRAEIPARQFVKFYPSSARSWNLAQAAASPACAAAAATPAATAATHGAATAAAATAATTATSANNDGG